MFIAALFPIAKSRKQPDCLVDEWINRMIYMHNEYYSLIRKKEILSHATIRIKLTLMLSRGSQSRKDKYCMIPLN